MNIVAILVFVGALIAIAVDFGHRTKVALTAAAIMVVLGIIDQEHAVEAIDWPTLGLLAGMMIIVGLTEPTGVFTYLALQAARLSKGRPIRLLFLLAMVTGILSAFLDNLTAILLVVPITLRLASMLRVSPIPLVLTEVLASNLGGTATLIGDPPNILIGSHKEELTFLDFIVNLAPVSFLSLATVSGFLAFVYRNSLEGDPAAAEEVARLDPRRDMHQAKYVKRSLAILLGTIVGFFVHQPLHVEPAVVAMTGATLMLVFVADDLEKALEKVEWSTLFFFIALFVMVGGLEERGLIDHVAEWLADITAGSHLAELMVVLWGSALGSAVVDNIPFTTAMLPVVDAIQGGQFDDGLWWALALGACFGGNATMIAAAANVAATGVLDRNGHKITFLRFLAIGVPATLISLVIATAYLLLFQL